MPVRLVRTAFAIAALATGALTTFAWAANDAQHQSLVNRSPNMWTLIGLGTSVAFVYSVVATFAPQVFPAALRRWKMLLQVPAARASLPPETASMSPPQIDKLCRCHVDGTAARISLEDLRFYVKETDFR